MTARIPVSTYRLQFNSSFRFADACALVPYLHQLGVTDIYASPLLQAKSGSPHGYDVTDPSRLNTALGTDEDFDALVTELHKHGMGLILDIVPNHMSASSENPWWMDVLENGSHSPFASHFDIDWHPPSRALEKRVLLPILGKPYAEALESCEMVLSYEGGAFFVSYYDVKLPVTMRSYRQILEYRLDRLQRALGTDAPAFQDFQGLLASLSQLPGPVAPPVDGPSDRRRREEIKQRLAHLYRSSNDVRNFIDRNVRSFNGRKGVASSFVLLDRLLSDQAYVLAFWQTANQEINYRRFFTISELIGLRVGDPMAFEASHALPLRLAAKGLVNGFRIDHIDGLRDPAGYLRRLQDRLADAATSPVKGLPFYLVVEKILSEGEALPSDWRVHGTTGYDFLNAVNELFIDRSNLPALEAGYRKLAGAMPAFEDLVYLKKKQIMTTLLSVEMRSAGRYLALLAAQDRYAREIPRDDLTHVLIETTACLPVYRTYLNGFGPEDQERHWIEKALAEAQARNPRLDRVAVEFVRQVLLLEAAPHVLPEQREQRLSFVLTWQQMTGPITAKGIEDSVLYIYNRLISLNEVGGSPDSQGRTPSELHAFLERQHKTWPFTMNATMTHDTKHAEDFRARVNVLSEIPNEWNERLRLWSAWNADKRTEVGSRRVPEPNEEILIYQVLLGSWPLTPFDAHVYRRRVHDFVIKAGREAMVHTRWTVPNLEHERALTDFVGAILDRDSDNRFLTDFQRFVGRISFCGCVNSLSQLLIKIGAPGVADFYQGAELWDLRLVDPDNRAPVDFRMRRQKLRELAESQAAPRDLLSHWQDGSIKLYVTARALRERRQRGELFLKGSYLRLPVRGKQEQSIFAFARHFRRSWSLIVVPRQVMRLAQNLGTRLEPSVWGDTAILLPSGAPTRWRDIFTGRPHVSRTLHNGAALISVKDLLPDLPVALLRDTRGSD
jgi:(1->4)-alpha-D-glucan 1-alpha-D-glucosylmutase